MKIDHSLFLLFLASSFLWTNLLMSVQSHGQVARPVKGFNATQQEKFFSNDATWAKLWDNGEFTEGPAVAPDGKVYFSDIGNRMMRYDPRTGKTDEFRNPSHRSNGLFFRNDGALVVCEGANTGGGRKISLSNLKTSTSSTIVDRFKGKKFNSPNDLFITSAGTLFFTDPRYVGDEPVELDFQGVFRVTNCGKINVATDLLTRPNGILVNEKETKAFVAEHHPTADKHLVAFDINPCGEFTNKKILFDFGTSRGIDGMCFGPNGNVFATAGDKQNSGIYVFSRTGKQLAFVPTPGAPTNCTFGRGKLSKRLYLTCANSKSVSGTSTMIYGLYFLDIQ